MPRKPPEIKKYTVLLLVPPDVQEKAGVLETVLVHVSAPSVAVAIHEARELAASERDCDGLAVCFTTLLVLAGHHDELLFTKE